MHRKVWLPILVAVMTGAVVVPILVAQSHPASPAASVQATVRPLAPATSPVEFGVYGMSFTPDQALAANAAMSADRVWAALGAPGPIPATVTPQFGTLTHEVASANGTTIYQWKDRPVWAFSAASTCSVGQDPGYSGPTPTVPSGPVCSTWIFADPTSGAQIAELVYDPWLDNQIQGSPEPTTSTSG